MLVSSYIESDVVSDCTWIYVRSAITSLGPAFVKLAQWIATRRDLFPPHLCDRLAVLQDRGISHSWKDTDAALRKAFGSDYRQRGLHIDRHTNPIGSGSAAQVYKGVLERKDPKTGERTDRAVAVKVLHPDLEALVDRDLFFVQSIVEILHSLPFESIKMLNLPRATSNCGSILRRQADLRIEAENLRRFRDNFYANEDEEKASAVLFPKPMDGWVSSDILVEDLVSDATPIASYLHDSSEEGLVVRRELAGPLLRAFLKMVFLDNFVHSDLHAGNILIRTSIVDRKPSAWDKLLSLGKEDNDNEPTTETKRQIVFLDAGIATCLNADDQRNLKDLFRAIILNDGREAGRLMVERAKYERCSEREGGVEAFSEGIEALVSEFHDRRQEGLTLGAVRIGSLLSRVLDLCRYYGVEIDPSMASIVVSTLVLEGLGRSLEPNLNLIDFAVPFVLGRGRV